MNDDPIREAEHDGQSAARPARLIARPVGPHMARKESILDCRTALLTLLDQIDYTAGNCRPNEMIGAILPANVLALCREAAQQPLAADPALPVGPCPFCERGEAHPKEFCYREIRRAANKLLGGRLNREVIMQKEIEAILIEFDALWGGADANSSKQETWRKELVARIVNAAQQGAQRTCAKCGNSGKPITDIGGNQSCPECGASRPTKRTGGR